jgi:SAM-dependent methyltransferase
LRRKAGARSAAVNEHADVGKLQQEHFDSIASDYAAHYGDPWSQVYRRRFINEPMLGDIALSGARVIDAMCGSGETTGFLLEKGAQVTGVDISQKEMTLFQERFPSCKAKQTSILSTGLESNAYDCVVVVGGLHHLHPQVPAALNEVHRVLKPGGYFCFTEPHRGSLADRVRQLWYGVDKLFAANEAAIDLEALKEQWASRFEFVKEEYKGNIAYLLVLNSLIFRIPLRLKPLYSPLLVRAETIIQTIQGKTLSCFVVGQWRKR